MKEGGFDRFAAAMGDDYRAETNLSPDEAYDLIAEAADLSLPSEVFNELRRATSLIEALDCVTFWLRRAINANRASVAIADKTGMLQVWALRGASTTRSEKGVPQDWGRIGRCFQGRRLILSRDMTLCNEPDSRSLRRHGLRRCVNTPIVFANETLGVLSFCVEQPEDLTLRKALLTQLCADALAPVVRAMQIEELGARPAASGETGDMGRSFIAHVSHEIRTPLNGVLGMAQAMARDELCADQREKLDIILSSGQSLLTILNDMLDISKIESGKLTIMALRSHIAQTVEEVAALWRERAAEKGLSIHLSLADNLPQTLIFDRDRVRQCLSNLISNAIKFSDTGEIRLSAQAKPRGPNTLVQISVEDHGVGIAENDRDRIFEPFQQACDDGSKTGTGLGLPIARRIARLLGGDLTVESELGRGACFRFSFLAQTTASEVRADQSTVAGRAAQPQSAQDLPPGLRVLVAEDVPTNRFVARHLLLQAGCDVSEAENGQVALDRLECEDFDVLLLDMQMPVLDGPQTIAAIRKHRRFRQLPVIALTADAMLGDRERFLRLGIDGYVAKPIDAKRLTTEIARVIRR